MVDARDFYYSRISMAMGDDIVLEILDREGTWQYVNDYFAAMNNHKRAWFVGKSLFEQFPQPGAPLIRGFRMSGLARRNTSSSAATPDSLPLPSPLRRKHTPGSYSIPNLRVLLPSLAS
ncbi:MAG: hypothetical protein WBM04_16375, partial [Candidatus Korobacteraceae bacterium]